MKNVESIDFMYVFVNMVYEPWFWVILFFGVGLGFMGMSYLNKPNKPPNDGV